MGLPVFDLRPSRDLARSFLVAFFAPLADGFALCLPSVLGVSLLFRERVFLLLSVTGRLRGARGSDSVFGDVNPLPLSKLRRIGLAQMRTFFR